MRVQVNGSADQVYYLLTDHLGSTTVSYRSDGGETRFQQYYPWGEFRPGPGTSLPTDRTYTGQRWDSYITNGLAGQGVYWMGSRLYDSALGRFLSPDSIVPEAAQGVQAWDRYAYANNNPTNFNDPTGHCIDPDSCAPEPPIKEKQVPPIPPLKSGNLDSDKLGKAILGRYLTGGGDWNIVYDQEWTDYMSANPTLSEDLYQRAVENAQFMIRNGYSNISIDETYPMEIENGEAIIGYQYLHGTDWTVGGFYRLGGATMVQTSDGGYEVSFSMSYSWNDKIDPNPIYITDKVKSTFAEIITLGKATPYDIHISWTQNIVIRLDSNGKIFRNLKNVFHRSDFGDLNTVKKHKRIITIFVGFIVFFTAVWIVLILYFFTGVHQYVPKPIYSPDGSKVIIPAVNYNKDDYDTYLLVLLKIQDTHSGKILYQVQTRASDRMRWSVSWINNKTIQLKSSDIGLYCWKENKEIWGEIECP